MFFYGKILPEFSQPHIDSAKLCDSGFEANVLVF